MACNLGTQTSTQIKDGTLTSTFPIAPAVTAIQHPKRHKPKPKPNLRINVGDNAMEDSPPPPPPKSPRLLPQLSSSGSFSTTPQSPVSPQDVKASFDSSATLIPSLAVQASYIPLGADMKVRELTVQPTTARERPIRKLLPQFLSSASSTVSEKPLHLPRKPLSQLNLRTNSISPVDASEKPSPLLTSRSLSPNDNTKPGASSDDFTKKRYLPYRSPDPQQAQAASDASPSEAVPSNWTARTYPRRPVGDRHHAVAQDATSSTSPLDSTIRLDSNTPPLRRMAAAAGPLNSHPYIANPVPPQVVRPTILESTTLPRTKTPSPARIASGVALSSTSKPIFSSSVEASSLESPERSDRSQSPPPELSVGAFSRAITPEFSSSTSRVSWNTFLDPVERLKELTERCEVLHTKYASLRADRQKISGEIIASLKNSASDRTETLDTLLDGQLSLAAVSSSMDICFAKLRALECQKEEAVAALVAQVSSLKRNVIDSIAGSPARNCSFRNQLTPSLESLRRHDRLTEEPAEAKRVLQLTELQIDQEPFTSAGEVDSPRPDITPKAERSRTPCGLAPALDVSPKTDSVMSHSLPREPSLAAEWTNENGDDGCMSALEEMLPQDDPLYEGTRRMRVEGLKAAKILGLLARSSRQTFDAAPLPDGFEDLLLRKQPELELEISSVMRPQNPELPTGDYDEGTPLFDAFKGRGPKDSRASSIDPRRPSTPPIKTILPPLPFESLGSSVSDSLTQILPDAPEASSSPKSVKSVKSLKSIKSYKSTKKAHLHQTIRVFMDDDILEYYRALQRW